MQSMPVLEPLVVVLDSRGPLSSKSAVVGKEVAMEEQPMELLARSEIEAQEKLQDKKVLEKNTQANIHTVSILCVF